MNKFDMNQMRKQVEAMHRLKAEAQAVEHIGESFDALEAEIGEVAELLEELGDALINVSEMLTGILSGGADGEENDENDEDDDYDCGDCCECRCKRACCRVFRICCRGCAKGDIRYARSGREGL